MHRIIYDCDNTMGVKEKDVDDGLTLLYLLGREDIEILGITTTYGNSTIEVVYTNTLQMIKELHLHHIPLLKGGPSSEKRQSDAARFLCEKVASHPKEITIVATGSLTNLLGAYEMDIHFFENVKEIILMGGITEPLIINGKNLDELNFSCDAYAAYKVLTSGAKITVITGHICLQALFGKREYKRLIENEDIKIYQYIRNKTIHWFEFIRNYFGIDGFYNWDIVAAVYLSNPELFNNNIIHLSPTPQDLKTGFLKQSDKGYHINIPTAIKDMEKFNEIIFATWANIKYK
ncbi:nucleoside hydrolase [Serpentinicella alkaliphila]|uniref:Inosine-uridine nucleoside N-ribohydrolase n=1 Tax=Serpentinicella alkaliphila TaxID=1734049 RepID=A0A4R2TGN0_9FIRM|nr:nucleoside hydrolase [Serpentinicella alkaliphila]QUH24601.1 nucleoside hydrolase [Serpentinicella alkaliphila]TCQ02598.1 inosine-uridine nucleoside N-ribohydrolase [Serpentinicella alkaliphila]